MYRGCWLVHLPHHMCEFCLITAVCPVFSFNSISSYFFWSRWLHMHVCMGVWVPATERGTKSHLWGAIPAMSAVGEDRVHIVWVWMSVCVGTREQQWRLAWEYKNVESQILSQSEVYRRVKVDWNNVRSLLLESLGSGCWLREKDRAVVLFVLGGFYGFCLWFMWLPINLSTSIECTYKDFLLAGWRDMELQQPCLYQAAGFGVS